MQRACICGTNVPICAHEAFVISKEPFFSCSRHFISDPNAPPEYISTDNFPPESSSRRFFINSIPIWTGWVVSRPCANFNTFRWEFPPE